jgi:twitching motility protein PilT
VSNKIDLYLNSLAKFGAAGVQLEGDSSVVFKFATGDRHANQTTPNELLMALVRETAPPAAAAELAGQRVASYRYDHQSGPYTVAVEPAPGRWKVHIEPGAPADSAPPAPVAEELPIERHNYSEARVEARPAASASISTRGMAVSGSDTGIDTLLRQMFQLGASDLHLCSACKPYVRLDGEMKVLEDHPVYTDESLFQLIESIMPARNREEYAERNDTDFAYSIEGLSRFRVNIFRDRKGPGAVIRSIPFTILSPEDLGLPRRVLDLCYLTKGLVLVTGPTGSGKSTTLATMIDFVNTVRNDHIITIEDPIEFVHDNKKCLVNQREVREHTDSFKDALRAALREDPDIVLVGEMRDLETIAIAVETAETGHLVFGTLHTTTAPSTVDRIIDQFPADRQEQIRQMLSESLAGVIAQTLCRKKGGGRVAAYEILMANSAVRNLIREKKTFQLFSLMQTGGSKGMRTLNTALIELVKTGVVEPMEAYMKAVNKGEIETLLQREGHTLDIGGQQ